MLVDEVVIRQHKREAERKAAKAKLAKAAAHCKGKATRPHYKNMVEPDYIVVRCNDWYTTALRDEAIEDRCF
jgi:hypothetical protein